MFSSPLNGIDFKPHNSAAGFAELYSNQVHRLATVGVSLSKARESDTAEVDALRDVAFIDLVAEMGRADSVIPLGMHQKMLSALA